MNLALFRHNNTPESKVVRNWHSHLLKQPQRGIRAGLRRAHAIDEAAMQAGFHGLMRRLEPTPNVRTQPPERRTEVLSSLAATAAAVAMIGGNRGEQSLGTQFGTSKGGSAPRVSEARFRRLLEADDLETRFSVLRRLLPLLGGLNERQANLSDVAAVLCDWTPDRKRRLAYDYYQAAAQKTKEKTK